MQPDFVAATYVERGILKELLRDYTPESLGVYAILSSNRYVPYRVRALIEHLARFLSGGQETPPEKKRLKRVHRKGRKAASPI
jgi:DNA-binding transcriptional LysR family regulator